MSKQFRKAILNGLDLENDYLAWLPLLELASSPTTQWQPDATILKLGPASFGRLAMISVEQYALKKKLNGGSTERLRERAIEMFLNASTVQAYCDGEATALQRLSDSHPSLVEWVANEWQDRGKSYRAFWRECARAAFLLMSEIRDQNQRKGMRGNVGRSGSHPFSNPDSAWLDVVDSAAIATASNNVDITERNNPSAIRAQIRPAVKEFFARGIYGYAPEDKSRNEAVDVAVRRVQRKFDDFDARLVAEGKVSPHPIPNFK